MRKLTDEEKQKRALSHMVQTMMNKERALESELMHLAWRTKSTKYVDTVIRFLNNLKKDLEEDLDNDG